MRLLIVSREGNLCGKCRKKASFDRAFAAYYCPSCNLWLEPKCPDANCFMCKARPEKPIPKS